MAHELTGIERQLVLRYLIDGNAPITVSPMQKNAPGGAVCADSSRIFPVAVRSDQMTVLEQGIILLKDPGDGVRQFVGTDVRVQFYFNRLGLYFVTKLKLTSSGLALVVPSAILRVTDVKAEKKHDMSAVLYYETDRRSGGMHIDCDFSDDYPLFVVPKWSDIPERDAAQASGYARRFGNDGFLIPVCRYLAHTEPETAALQGTLRAPVVLYLDKERIVFGADTPSLRLRDGGEYALKLGIPLTKPLRTREVYVTCLVSDVFASDDAAKSCAVCTYTSITEEDARFLSDMMRT